MSKTHSCAFSKSFCLSPSLEKTSRQENYPDRGSLTLFTSWSSTNGFTKWAVWKSTSRIPWNWASKLSGKKSSCHLFLSLRSLQKGMSKATVWVVLVGNEWDLVQWLQSGFWWLQIIASFCLGSAVVKYFPENSSALEVFRVVFDQSTATLKMWCFLKNLSATWPLHNLLLQCTEYAIRCNQHTKPGANTKSNSKVLEGQGIKGIHKL